MQDTKKKYLNLLLLPLILISNLCFSNENVLTLEQYLTEVKKTNDSFKSNTLLEEAGVKKSSEGFLTLSPQLFAKASYLNDSQPPVSEPLSGKKTLMENYSIGMTKKFSTGTSVKFEYDNIYTDITEPSPSLVYHDEFWYAKPIISIEQPLFRDWLGKETKALIALKNSQAIANQHLKKFENQKIIMDATNVYWDLATLNENINIKRQSVDRSRKLLDWVTKRTNLGLSNKSDLLQAKSALLQRHYELQALLDLKKTKSRLFNALRNIKSDSMNENLTTYKEVKLEQFRPSDKNLPPSIREDLKAKFQAQIVSKSQAELSTQSITPSVALKVQYYPSGRDTHYNHTMQEALRAKHNTYAVNVNFNMPLDLNLNSNLISANKAEKHAAELAYARAKFEVENEWKLLTEQYELLSNQLNLAKALEETQEEKLKNEQELLKNGRTTTFNVLQFEQDLLNSQMQYYTTKNRLLNLTAAMQLFM